MAVRPLRLKEADKAVYARGETPVATDVAFHSQVSADIAVPGETFQDRVLGFHIYYRL